MKLIPMEQAAIKVLYSLAHTNEIKAEQALEALEIMVVNGLERDETEDKTIKRIYDFYNSNEINADEALQKLELMFNETEICQGCLTEIDENNPLINPDHYSVNDRVGYCVMCYDPTPQ
jgi:superfamily I DNA and/or RNA helicase